MALPDAVLAGRFGRLIPLTDDERAGLGGLDAQSRAVPRGTLLRRERDPAATMWVLRRGWAASALSMPDGSRQITQIHLPGDLLGVPSAALESAAETITTLTDAVVCPFGKPALGTLFADHPRIALLTFLISQLERLALADRIAAIGRTDARARLGGLLLDLLNRMRAAGQATDDGFVVPLTQEEIGDAIGLTAVHVNRMMRALAEERLIARAGGGVIRILDEGGLVGLSGYVNRWARLDLGWLPPPE